MKAYEHQKELASKKLRSTTSLSQAIKKMEGEGASKEETVPLEVNGTATFNFTFDDGKAPSNLKHASTVPPYLQNEYAKLMANGISGMPKQSPDAMFPTSSNELFNTLASPQNGRNLTL